MANSVWTPRPRTWAPVSVSDALQLIAERGPCYAVDGTVRRNEVIVRYADNALLAERHKHDMDDAGYHQVEVHPPVGRVDLAPLAEARRQALAAEREATFFLCAAALRELEAGRAEAEVARQAGVDRMTVRAWAGKS